MIKPFWKTVCQFPIKQIFVLPHNLTIALLGIYPNKLKSYIYIKTCTWDSVEALFIIVEITKSQKMFFSR